MFAVLTIQVLSLAYNTSAHRTHDYGWGPQIAVNAIRFCSAAYSSRTYSLCNAGAPLTVTRWITCCTAGTKQQQLQTCEGFKQHTYLSLDLHKGQF